MDEYLRQHEEETKKYHDYIAQRRQQVESRLTDTFDQIKQDREQKFELKKKVEDSQLLQIIQRLPPAKVDHQFNDVNDILEHLNKKRQDLANK